MTRKRYWVSRRVGAANADRQWLVVCCMAALSAGCYTYAPASLETVPLGAEVRALVSTEGQVKLLHDFGIDSRSIAGTLESKEEDRVRVAVRAIYSAATPGSPALYQHVELPPRDLLRIDVRHLDRFRTGGFIALLAGTATTVAILVATGRFEGGSPPPANGLPPAR